MLSTSKSVLLTLRLTLYFGCIRWLCLSTWSAIVHCISSECEVNTVHAVRVRVGASLQRFLTVWDCNLVEVTKIRQIWSEIVTNCLLRSKISISSDEGCLTERSENLGFFLLFIILWSKWNHFEQRWTFSTLLCVNDVNLWTTFRNSNTHLSLSLWANGCVKTLEREPI